MKKMLFFILALLSTFMFLSSINAEEKKPTYKINFPQVVLSEYVRFVGKICNANFLFDDKELNIPVSIVSQEATSTDNIMAILIQILRVHGFSIIEENHMLVIHKNDDVKSLSQIVTPDMLDKNSIPIITCVFTIKTANINTIANIIKGLISKNAALEIAAESNQIIITDFSMNIKKIKDLIDKIEAPDAGLKIQAYVVKNGAAENIATLASKILAPLANGTTLILTPQLDSNIIYITAYPKIIDKTIQTLQTLDVTQQKQLNPDNIFTYKPKYQNAQFIIHAINDVATHLSSAGYAESGLIKCLNSAKILADNYSVMFTGTKEDISTTQTILVTIDIADSLKRPDNNFYLYKTKNISPKQLLSTTENLAETLKKSESTDKDLIYTLNNAQYIKDLNAVLFTGTTKTLNSLKTLLANSIDIAQQNLQTNIFIYQPKNISSQRLMITLQEMAPNLKTENNEELMSLINDIKIVKESDSLLFRGSQKTIEDIKLLINSIDTTAAQTTNKQTFYLYKIQNSSDQQIIAALNEMEKHLSKSSSSNIDLIETLHNVKTLFAFHSLLFTGPSATLKEIENILKKIDVKSKIPETQNFLLYEPKKVTPQKLEKYLKEIAVNLNIQNPQEVALKNSILSMKWLNESNSFMFNGSDSSLTKLKNILNDFDTTAKVPSKNTYFLYKLQNISGQTIEAYLDNFAKNIKEKKLGKEDLVNAINDIKWVKETNSILITGDPTTIEEVKKLIQEFDLPQKGKITTGKADFFIYKPEHTPKDIFEQKMKDVVDNLQKAELTDEGLISSLNSMKYIESNTSFVFTGNAESLKKVQSLIKTIDTPSITTTIQHVGKQTFLLYKLKNASFLQIKTSIKSLIDDLKKVKTVDKPFLETLNSMRYVKESNSILFTGSDETLEKAQKLVENFDIRTSVESKAGPGSFYLYKPLHLSGPALETILQDFANHLKANGFENEELYSTINSMKWIENTKSLVFTGSAKSIEEVKNLLASFDVSSGKMEPLTTQAPIQPINNVSFLVYKLQYHKGDEIQVALKQIAKNMEQQGTKVDPGLLSAVQSVQWIEITNSLLCSGPQDTIEKLKELIKNLDVPLKQVFIEMLVIKTEMSNLLSFGLDWGGKFKYKNKVGASTGNFPALQGGQTNLFNQDPFAKGLNSVNGTTITPDPNSMIPFQSGFDFGVIGDIIMHKGKSFLSMGSLINALQNDNQVTTIMTPKIIAQDGKTSKIFSGENIPYVGSWVTTTGANGANTVQSQNLEYRDIGVGLTITPVLGNADTVTLDIQLDQSTELANVPLGTSNQISGITTAKTNMSTTVHIPDKKFLILSGMVLESKTRTKTGIPCLGGLPLIGAAFSTNNDSTSRDNIVIFIRPHIINSYKDMNTITNNQEDYFRDYTGTPTLEQEFDESIDNLKSYSEEDFDEEAE